MTDENWEIFPEKVKFRNFSTESEKFVGNRGKMHHCLRGMHAHELKEGWQYKNRGILKEERPGERRTKQESQETDD